MIERVEKELKAAMLSGDKTKVEILKGLKNAALYEAVGLKVKPNQLTEEQVAVVFRREAKKRQEAAELYENAGELKRAEAEMFEKAVIDEYLPRQLQESEIQIVVDEKLSSLTEPSIKDLGRLIGAVKAKLGTQADGAVIARLVKKALENK
ncbi:GatB/YqeY domain-containing protein [Candidatus Saccharibacteria bacterium]|nr:GatB/YqeY domain-containing protein [Candidatus Saccharibacteria bacterium]